MDHIFWCDSCRGSIKAGLILFSYHAWTPKFSKGKLHAQGHTVRGWEREDLNLALLVEDTF